MIQVQPVSVPKGRQGLKNPPISIGGIHESTAVSLDDRVLARYEGLKFNCTQPRSVAFELSCINRACQKSGAQITLEGQSCHG
jgi:hypothetical protein